MKSIFIAPIFLLFIFNASAQELKFTLLNSETKEPMEGVEIFSHESHDKVVYTDKVGNAAFLIKNTDTLIFFKELYHPLYIQVKALNFDNSHNVVLKMVPTNGESHGYMTRQFDQLQKSEYHFVHNDKSDNSIKITNFKSPSMVGYPKYNDKAFHVVEIGFDNKNKPKSSYLKK